MVTEERRCVWCNKNALKGNEAYICKECKMKLQQKQEESRRNAYGIDGDENEGRGDKE